ncbi:MAG: hypothetical protein ABI355_07545 [Solirubrobacteraceae bacterium]
MLTDGIVDASSVALRAVIAGAPGREDPRLPRTASTPLTIAIAVLKTCPKDEHATARSWAPLLGAAPPSSGWLLPDRPPY